MKINPLTQIARISAIIICLLFASPKAVLAAQCTGDNDRIWLLNECKDKDAGVNIYTRNSNSKWKLVDTISAMPLSVQALDDRIFIVFDKGICRFIDTTGKYFNIIKLPLQESDSLVLCKSSLQGSKYKTITAIISNVSEQNSTQPASTNMSPPQTTRALALSGSKWLPVSITSPKIKPSIHTVTTDGSVLAITDDMKSLISLDKAVSTRIQIPSKINSPLKLMQLGDHIILINSSPSQNDGFEYIQIHNYNIKKDKSSWVSKFIKGKDGKILQWKKDNLPDIAGTSKSLFLVWQIADKSFSLTCPFSGPNSAIATETEITKEIQRGPLAHEERSTLIETFFLIITIISVVLIFINRPKSREELFTLPEMIRPVHFGYRCLAFLIDVILADFLTVFIYVLAVGTEKIDKMNEYFYTNFANFTDSAGNSEQFMASEFAPVAITVFFMLSVIFAIYCIAFEYFFGATVGKMIFKIQVIASNGTRPNFQQIVLRNLMKLIEINAMAMLILVPILLLWPILSRHKQRLGDQFARTAVISNKSYRDFLNSNLTDTTEEE